MKNALISVLAVVFLALSVCAQVAVVPLNLPHITPLGSDGIIMPGGKIYTYVAGTTTLLATYSDASGTTLNTNPVVLDASGSATIFLKTQQSYKLVAKNAAGVTQWTIDNLRTLAILGKPFLSGLLAARPTTCSASIEFFVQTDSPYTLWQCNAAGTGWNSDGAAYLPSSIGTAGQQLTVNSGATASIWQSKPVYDIRDYGGACDGVVNNTTAIESAITAATSTGGIVQLPAGTCSFGAISSWLLDAQGSESVTHRTAAKIPSNVWIRGQGLSTSITVTRSDCADVGSLFANAHRTATTDTGIRLSDMSVTMNDTTESCPNQWTAPFLFSQVTRLEFDHIYSYSTANRTYNILDPVSRFSFHNNESWVYENGGTAPNPLRQGYGDAALAINEFAIASGLNTGEIYDNTFVRKTTPDGFSDLVLSASGFTIAGNHFDGCTQRADTGSGTAPIGSGNSIEVGLSNLSKFPSTLSFTNNDVCGENIYPVAFIGGTVSNNRLNNPYDAIARPSLKLTAAGGGVLNANYGAVVSGNIIRNGDLSIQCETGDTCWHDVTAKDNVIYDGSLAVDTSGQAITSSSATNNTVWNPPDVGIGLYRVSDAKGNIVFRAGQTQYNSTNNFGYDFNASTRNSVSYNQYVDDQTLYSTGTFCTVATAASTTCAAGTFLYAQGGATWNNIWTNRHIYSSATHLSLACPIRAFLPDGLHAELECSSNVATGTAYQLSPTTYAAMSLQGTTRYLVGNLLSATSWSGAPIVGTGETVTTYFGNRALTAGSNSTTCSGCAANYLYDTSNGTNGPVGNVTPSTVSATALNLPVLLASATAPTVSSGFGSSPSIASNNGTASFTVNVGTGGTASAGVIGLPTATTGWNCNTTNITATAANRGDQRTVQTASSTTSATIQNQTISTGAALAWSASDIIRVSCFAY
jgi:hypothetical protein